MLCPPTVRNTWFLGLFCKDTNLIHEKPPVTPEPPELWESGFQPMCFRVTQNSLSGRPVGAPEAFLHAEHFPWHKYSAGLWGLKMTTLDL